MYFAQTEFDKCEMLNAVPQIYQSPHNIFGATKRRRGIINIKTTAVLCMYDVPSEKGGQKENLFVGWVQKVRKLVWTETNIPKMCRRHESKSPYEETDGEAGPRLRCGVRAIKSHLERQREDGDGCGPTK